MDTVFKVLFIGSYSIDVVFVQHIMEFWRWVIHLKSRGVMTGREIELTREEVHRTSALNKDDIVDRRSTRPSTKARFMRPVTRPKYPRTRGYTTWYNFASMDWNAVSKVFTKNK